MTADDRDKGKDKFYAELLTASLYRKSLQLDELDNRKIWMASGSNVPMEKSPSSFCQTFIINKCFRHPRKYLVTQCSPANQYPNQTDYILISCHWKTNNK